MNRKTLRLLCTAFIASCFGLSAQAQPLTWVKRSGSGKLEYKRDANGNRIPDFSMVGYRQGEELPRIPKKATLRPSSGDRTADIKDAIDRIAAMPVQANGYRGALVLKKGLYEVSNTIALKNGVVIRGEGAEDGGTEIRMALSGSGVVFKIAGKAPVVDSSSRARVTGDYVPLGAFSLRVESGHSFSVGDRVVLTTERNAQWLSDTWMDRLSDACGGNNWNYEGYTMSFRRRVTAVNGRRIRFDAPIVEPIESQYGNAYVEKFSWKNVAKNIGIENLKIASEFNPKRKNDEQNSSTAIALSNAEDVWVDRVHAHYFSRNCVRISGNVSQATVQNSKYLNPLSKLTGGRRYAFVIGGGGKSGATMCLFKNCFADKARHDFVTGARVTGPHVFTRCTATNSIADSGPHGRWAAGILYDNLVTDERFHLGNRACLGTGQGWGGVNHVLWNCTTHRYIAQDPPTSSMNFLFGCKGGAYSWNFHKPVFPSHKPAIRESHGKRINSIPSLYEAQVEDK
ncbi:MAG: hypothetical protein AAF483_17565 [Planctomycetota bacterium]